MVSASKSPWCNRTQCPSRRSIAGRRSIGMSERALGRRNARPFDADRVAQRTRHALERGLDDVVTITTGERLDVQRDPGTERERPPEFLGELWVEGADPLRARIDVVDEKGTAREVERDLHQRFVERDQRRREPPNPRLVSERLLE